MNGEAMVFLRIILEYSFASRQSAPTERPDQLTSVVILYRRLQQMALCYRQVSDKEQGSRGCPPGD